MLSNAVFPRIVVGANAYVGYRHLYYHFSRQQCEEGQYCFTSMSKSIYMLSGIALPHIVVGIDANIEC